MAHNDSMVLVPYQPIERPSLVTPLVDPREAAEAIHQYEALKAAVVQKSDVQIIQGRTFLKKSFWRRVATCFGLSLELVTEERGVDERGSLFYSVIYRAIAPNGRSMTADGYCSTSEPGRGNWPEHNVRATAHTRAKNRAISDLVGGGEVSAEEMSDHDDDQRPQGARPTPVTPVRKSSPQAQPAHAASHDDEDVIPSMPEPDQELEPVSAAPSGEWKFLQDVEFRQALNRLGRHTVMEVEVFVQEVTGKAPTDVTMADRDVCIATAKKRLAAKRGNRGPHALAATAINGETVPDSLEGVFGQRGA